MSAVARGFEPEGFSFLREMQHLGHVEQRLEHAAAEDAEAAELLRSIDDTFAETVSEFSGVETERLPITKVVGLGFHWR